MAEENTEPVVVTFKDFIGSQEYIDHLNTEKGKWAKDYQDKKIPELRQNLEVEITERVRKELNPEETPEQKRIRELEDKISISEKSDILNQKKSSLREKAKEIKFDVSRADRYAVYGDKAEEYMTQDAEWAKTLVAEAIDKNTKEVFNGGNPPKGEPEGGFDVASRMNALKKKL